MLDELWRWRPGLVSEQKKKKKKGAYESMRQHCGAWLRGRETWMLWMNVSTEWGWSFINEMMHYEPDWLNESARLLPTWQRVGKGSAAAFASDMCLPWQRCRTYLNSNLAFFEWCSVKWLAISKPGQIKKKNPTCIQSITCIMGEQRPQ